jgi:hypothetical protein
MDQQPAAKQPRNPVKGRGYLLYGFAAGFGAVLAALALIQIKMAALLIPLIAYIVCVIFNILTQKTICANANVSQAFKLSTISAGVVASVYFAANNIHFLGNPIRSLIPNSDAATQQRVIMAFYLFWAGLYSQILSGGFMQTCAAA